MDIQIGFKFAMALTLDDYNNNQKYIKTFYKGSYWLATGAGNYFSIYSVRDTGEVEPENGLHTLEVRPGIYVDNKYIQLVNNYIGKSCTIDEDDSRQYTILNDGILIADFSICRVAFIDPDSIVREANHYDKSLVKYNIINWFTSHFDDLVTLHFKN